MVIAVHFGLSAKAEGFTLERLARNEIAADRPDNAGGQPGDTCIVEGGAGHPSTLPLEAIASALGKAGLLHSWSDDAGGYLCNYIFYLSRSPHFPDFRRKSAASSTSRRSSAQTRRRMR